MTVKLAGLCAVVLTLVSTSCGSAEDTVAVGRTRQALSFVERVLGFESVEDWVTSAGNTGAGTVTSEGQASLLVTASGYTEVWSVALTSLGSVRGTACHREHRSQ